MPKTTPTWCFTSKLAAFAALSLTILPTVSRAVDGTWNPPTNQVLPTTWGTASNWTSSIIADGAGSIANLTSYNLTLANQTITLEVARTLGTLRLGDSNNQDRRSYILSGAALTFDNTPNSSNAVLLQNSTSAGDSLDMAVILNSSLDVYNAATDRALTITGGISSGTTGLKTISSVGSSQFANTTSPFAFNTNAGNITISGIISDGAGQVAIVSNSPGNALLTLSGVNTFTGGVTLSTGTLVLGNNAALGAATSALTINGGYLNVSAATTLSNNNPIIWNGDFSYLGSNSLNTGTGAITLNGARNVAVLANTLTMPGSIADGTAGSSLIKSGAGTLTLSGTNTYTGGTVVNSGILRFANAGAVSSTGSIRVNSGAVVGTDFAINQTFVDRIDSASVGVVALAASSSNALNLGNLANVRLGAIGSVTLSGVLTPNGTTFRLGGGGGTLTVSSALSGATNSLEVGIQGSSVGNVTLSGNNTYGGTTTIRGPATLQINGLSDRIADTSNIIIAGNGTFRYDNTGAGAAITETVGSLQFQAGDGTVLSQRTINFDTTLTVAGITRTAGATGNFNVGGTNSATSVNKVVISTAPATAAFLDQGLFVGGSSYAAYDATGAGFIRALAYGTDANTASVGAAVTLATGSGKHINVTGNISGQTSDSVLSLRLASATNLTLATNATLIISQGGILKAGSTASIISGGTGITTNGSTELVIRTDASGDTLTVNSSILSTSTGGLTKSGAGTLVLGAANAYTGNTTLNGGTLRAMGTTALSTGTVVIRGGTLDLRANGSFYTAPEVLNFGNNVVVEADSTITINNLNAVTNFRNKTVRMGDLTIGSNTLTVSNNNGYGLEFAGTTTLSPGATGNSILTIGAATPSNLIQGLTLSGKVTGTSNLIIRGGTVQLSNASNDFVGSLQVNSGVLAAANDGSLGNLANKIMLMDGSSTSTFRATGTFATDRVIVLGNRAAVNNVLQVTSGETLTLNSAFEGETGFIKTDNGTLEIKADNGSWAGIVVVHDGVLKVSNSGALGSAAGFTQVNNFHSALHLNGGTAGISIADDLYLANAGINSTGALLGLAGTGTNTVTGAIILNGATTIGVETNGTLNLTNPLLTYNLQASGTGVITNLYNLTLTGGGQGTLAAGIATGANGITKTGTGTWTLTGNSTFTGTPLVNLGTLVLNSTTGKLGVTGTAWQVSPGATLILDNTAGHLDNRLGTRGINLGGNLTILGDASAPTLETITSSSLVTGNVASIVTLDANSSQSLTLRITGGSFTRNAAGTTLFRGDNLGNAPGAGVATMLSSTVPTFIGQTGAAGTTNRGILPWALVDQSVTGLGTAFATYDSVRGILALNAVPGEQLNYLIGTTNAALTETKGALTATTVNSLTLGNGGGVSTQPLTTLTIDSGGILALTGNTGISGGLLQSTSNREIIIHALADLNISSVVTGSTNGLTKTGAGTLTLSAANRYTGATTVNQGTLKLAAGTNTILAGQALNVNYGGTLDLNGTTQTVGLFRSLGSSGSETALVGGTVTSSSGQGTFTISQSAGVTFAGQITGNIAFARSNINTLNLTSDNDYTGPTLLNGGLTALRNDGRLSGTSRIDIQYGSLRLENFALSDSSDRVNDSAEIILRGGTLSLMGAAGVLTTETVGIVRAVQGTNIITAANSSNNNAYMPEGATLTLSGLTRNASAGATISFGQTYSGTSNQQIGLLATTAGAAENILVTGGLALTNNIVGPWAMVSSYFNTNPTEFATYDPVGGVAALNLSGYAGYDGTVLPASSQPNQNIRITASGTVPTGGLTLNTLNIVGNGTAVVVNFASDTSVLNLASGGLSFSIDSNATTGTIGTAANNGRLTAGGSALTHPTNPVDLFLFHQNSAVTNVLTVNAGIIDNPTSGQKVRFIPWGGVFLAMPIVLTSTENTYSGGTVVNQQTLQIGTASFAGSLGTGGLTVNGGTVTQVNGGIPAQDVTLNGPSVLTLVGNNTLNALTFDNSGGGIGSTVGAPTLNVGSGTLTLNGNITATSSNVAATTTISGGTLSLGGSTRTISVAPITFNNQNLSPDQAAMIIASVVTGTGSEGIIKTGDGMLQLSGASTFTGGVDLRAGGLIIAGNSTGTVTNGPLGTGTLSIGANTTITADATARAVPNAVTINGDFTMGVRGPVSPAALTLSGSVAWGSTARKVTVDSSPTITNTISGKISGSGGITKEGLGTLALTADSSTTGLDWRAAGAITINNGTLLINSDKALGVAPTSATAGNIVLNGGALGASATMTLETNRGIFLGSSTGSGTGILDVAASGNTLTYGGVIANNGTGADHLLKTGAGKLTLTGTSTYTGNTIVAAGTIALGSAGSIDNSKLISVAPGATFDVTAVTAYTVKSGQTLEGGGTILGSVTALSGSIIAPGTAVNHREEKLTFTNVTLNSGSKLDLQISTPTFTSTNNFGNNAVGTLGYLTYITTNGVGQKEHDLLTATGTITQTTGAQIRVFGDNFTPAYGQIYNLLDWATTFTASSNLGLSDNYRTGAADSMYDLDLPDISGSGFVWDISGFASAGVLVIVNVVPEPSRCLLLMFATVAVFGIRRRPGK